MYKNTFKYYPKLLEINLIIMIFTFRFIPSFRCFSGPTDRPNLHLLTNVGPYGPFDGVVPLLKKPLDTTGK